MENMGVKQAKEKCVCCRCSTNDDSCMAPRRAARAGYFKNLKQRKRAGPHVMLPLGQRSLLPASNIKHSHLSPSLHLILISHSSPPLSHSTAMMKKMMLVATAVALIGVSSVAAQEAPAPSPASDAAAFLPAALASVAALALQLFI